MEQLQETIKNFEKGLDNPYISNEMKDKLTNKITELKAELQAKQNPPKLTTKDLEARLAVVKKMVKKDPTLKDRVKVIEKMIEKSKSSGDEVIKEGFVHIKKQFKQGEKIDQKIQWKQLERGEFEGLTPNYNFYIEHDDEQVILTIFDAKLKNDDEAFIDVIDVDSIEEAKQEAENYIKKQFKQGGQTWMQTATKEMQEKGTIGKFTKSAQKKGLTAIEFAKEVLKNKSKYPSITRKQAQFVKNTNPDKF